MIDILLVVTKNPRMIEIPSYVNLYKYTIEGRNKGARPFWVDCTRGFLS